MLGCAAVAPLPGPRPHPLQHQVSHTVGHMLCLSAYVSPAQSAARLDSDRTPSAPSTAERGMVKPMVRVEQQLDYRRQDSRWGRALGARGWGGHRGAGAGARSRGPADTSGVWAGPYGHFLSMSPN